MQRRLRIIAIASLIVLVYLVVPHVGWAQSYTARTDYTAQPYPGTIPCPSASGCSGGGALTGAGYCFTPSDFATQICRVTDQSSPGSQPNFGTDCGGSAETNMMDVSDTRFYVCTGGNVPVMFSFDGTTNPPTTAALYGAMLGGCEAAATYTLNLTFSYTQPKVAYAENYHGGNPALCQYDFTSSSTMPTYANGKITSLVDLSTCVAGLAGKDYNTIYTEDVSPSADDQTFAISGSTTSGQGSTGDVYVIVWNRTNGCRVWNTSTGAVTGSWGATGTISKTDTFYLHNVRMNKNGDWVKVSQNTCIGGGCTSVRNTYLWNIATLNVYAGVNDATAACGHGTVGYTHWINECSTGGNNTDFLERANTSDDAAGVQVTSGFPSPLSVQDAHISWNNGNSSDTTPVIMSLYTDDNSTTNACDNEITAMTTDGTGKMFRFAHTYITRADIQNFDAEFAIGNPSQDGKYYFWSTDWEGKLGQIGGGSSACTIGTDCRGDVFFAILSQSGTALSNGVKLSNGAKIQ